MVWELQGGGSNIRIKSLKSDIAERTRNCESLLQKITFPNIFEKRKHISSFDRPGYKDVGSFDF